LSPGRPDDDAPIIGPLTASGLVQWSWKRLQPTAKRVIRRGDISLYTLRHTHASACHYAGFTLPAAARRLGTQGRCTCAPTRT
jgi:integrase